MLRLRTTLLELARALEGGERVPGAAVAAINRAMGSQEGTQQLTRIGGAWRLRFAPAAPPPALAAIARSAASTLADPLVFVRRCAGPTCSLYFSDDSAGQGRRWCRTETCGRDAWVERRQGALR